MAPRHGSQRERRSALTQTHIMPGTTSQCPFMRTPPHGPLRSVFGQPIGQVMPVSCRMHWPHIRQPKAIFLLAASNGRTASSRERVTRGCLRKKRRTGPRLNGTAIGKGVLSTRTPGAEVGPGRSTTNQSAVARAAATGDPDASPRAETGAVAPGCGAGRERFLAISSLAIRTASVAFSP